MPIRYGRKTVMSVDGDVLVTEESVITDFNQTKLATIYTESVYVDNEKDVLAHYLTMLDKWKAGEIDLPSIKPLRGRNGNLRIEKSWTIPG